MRLPLEWLKEYVAVRLSPKQLAERMTMAGIEVGPFEDRPSNVIFDLEITPNRPDWLSIIGLAREVAVITGQRLKVAPSTKHQAPSKKQKGTVLGVKIVIEDKRGCQRYIGRLIEGVSVKPSPEWMQNRLIACGARPINNIVDITNYVLLEYGQPLHAFDADKLQGGVVRVRRALTNETITTLDGVKRALAAEMLVIADTQAPVAVAGIMGGQGTEVTQATRNILLESAYFDPVTVRRSARKLGLSSESSYRFERGIDPEGVARASERAAGLIVELGGGSHAAVTDVGSAATARVSIAFDPLRAQRWLGMPVAGSVARTAFAQLGCRVASSGTAGPMRVAPPTFRRDLTADVDLYEELARVFGYDRLPSSVPVVPLVDEHAAHESAFAQLQKIKQVCVGLGLTEVITWSLVSEADLLRCGLNPSEAVRLANPLSQDHAFLQPSLLMGLLQVARRNVTRGTTNVAVFELARITRAGREQPSLGMLLSGEWFPDWNTARQTAGFWVLKGLVESVARQASGRAMPFAAVHFPWAASGESAQISADGQRLGVAGKIAPKVLEAYDLKQPVWFAELSVEALLSLGRPSSGITPPSEFPPVKRDLSILIDERTVYQQVEQLIRQTAGSAAGRIELIDRFTGKQVPAGKQSLTFSLEYRQPARTLTAGEVDTVHARIMQALAGQLGAARR